LKEFLTVLRRNIFIFIFILRCDSNTHSIDYIIALNKLNRSKHKNSVQNDETIDEDFFSE
jgi:hypothetical protein